MWKPISGWSYSVSDNGDIRNDITGHILKPVLVGSKRKQYLAVSLHKDKKGTRKKVHVIVLETFIGPRPNDTLALHKDDNELNNSLSNLEWGSHKQNVRQAFINGGRRTKLTNNDYATIKQRRLAGERGRSLAKEFGVSEQFICDIVHNRKPV